MYTSTSCFAYPIIYNYMRSFKDPLAEKDVSVKFIQFQRTVVSP
jgi:hypothetical protein